MWKISFLKKHGDDDDDKTFICVDKADVKNFFSKMAPIFLITEQKSFQDLKQFSIKFVLFPIPLGTSI